LPGERNSPLRISSGVPAGIGQRIAGIIAPGIAAMTRPRRGKVELAVLRTLRQVTPTSPAHDGLAASALMLARTLDEGAGLATAAVARELRATLETLTKGASDDGSADATASLFAELSTPMGYTPN
jgi:hypothetical protein